MPFPQTSIHAGGGTKPFLLRQVITRGYILSGYQNASPWRNVNRMTHSTDTAVSLGDQLTASAAYPGGFQGATNAYLLRASNSWLPNTSAVAGFNMVTETGFSGPAAPYNIANVGNMMHQEQFYAWGVANAAASALMKFNFTTSAWMTSLSLSYVGYGGGGNSSFYHEKYGYTWEDAGSSGMRLTFSTETQSSTSMVGAHDQQKGISSKLTTLYAGGDGSYNGGYVLRRWNVTTETNVGNISKPVGNCGEENFDMGQDHQYMMGCYDGSQNNRAWRLNYLTDSGYEGSSTMQPKGVGGRSSGHCSYWG